MVTIAQLIACGLGPTQARTFLDPLNDAMERWAIQNVKREAAFIAQCMHESTKFTAMEESLFYRDAERLAKIFSSSFRSAAEAQPYVKNPKALANRVYANRIGNGDEASGDGWRYRGRGPLGLTGKDNYAAAGRATGLPLVSNPDLVAQPSTGCHAAAWFFKDKGCLPLADQGLIDEVTRKINPPMVGKIERREFFRIACEALRREDA